MQHFYKPTEEVEHGLLAWGEQCLKGSGYKRLHRQYVLLLQLLKEIDMQLVVKRQVFHIERQYAQHFLRKLGLLF